MLDFLGAGGRDEVRDMLRWKRSLSLVALAAAEAEARVRGSKCEDSVGLRKTSNSASLSDSSLPRVWGLGIGGRLERCKCCGGGGLVLLPLLLPRLDFRPLSLSIETLSSKYVGFAGSNGKIIIKLHHES